MIQNLSKHNKKSYLFAVLRRSSNILQTFCTVYVRTSASVQRRGAAAGISKTAKIAKFETMFAAGVVKAYRAKYNTFVFTGMFTHSLRNFLRLHIFINC